MSAMKTVILLLVATISSIALPVHGLGREDVQFLEIYGRLVRKTVLHPGILPRLQLPADRELPTDADQRVRWVSKAETAMAEAGLELIPDGDKFVWLVPAGISNSPVMRDLARIRKPVPAPDGRMEERVPAGMVHFRNMPLEQALNVFAELSGRTLLRPVPLRPAEISYLTQTVLTTQEVIYGLRVVFALNGVAVIEDGPKFFQVVPVRQAGEVRVAAPVPEPGEKVIDPASHPWFTPRLGAAELPRAANVLAYYAQLTDRRVVEVLKLGDRPVWFEPRAPLTRAEMEYGIETVLALNGLAIAVDENGAVSLTVAGEKRPAPTAAELPSQDRPGRP